MGIGGWVTGVSTTGQCGKASLVSTAPSWPPAGSSALYSSASTLWLWPSSVKLLSPRSGVSYVSVPRRWPVCSGNPHSVPDNSQQTCSDRSSVCSVWQPPSISVLLVLAEWRVPFLVPGGGGDCRLPYFLMEAERYQPFFCLGARLHYERVPGVTCADSSFPKLNLISLCCSPVTQFQLETLLAIWSRAGECGGWPPLPPRPCVYVKLTDCCPSAHAMPMLIS